MNESIRVVVTFFLAYAVATTVKELDAKLETVDLDGMGANKARMRRTEALSLIRLIRSANRGAATTNVAQLESSPATSLFAPTK